MRRDRMVRALAAVVVATSLVAVAGLAARPRALGDLVERLRPPPSGVAAAAPVVAPASVLVAAWPYNGGTKRGYTFVLATGTANFTWSAQTGPVGPARSGDRYFYVDADGVIRFTLAPPPTPAERMRDARGGGALPLLLAVALAGAALAAGLGATARRPPSPSRSGCPSSP